MIKATMSNVTGFTIVIVAFIEWLRNMDQGLLLMSFPAEYLKQLRGWRSCLENDSMMLTLHDMKILSRYFH